MKTSAIPRPEHPNPQFERTAWINLNGTWSCELDHSRSGHDAGEMLHGGGDRHSRRLWLSKGFGQPIRFDIARFVKPGETHDLVLCVRDNTRSGVQPAGKQSPWHHSRGCHYTRVTGIWQTVWLEAVPTCGLRDLQIIPDLDGARLHLVPQYWATGPGHALHAVVRSNGAEVATVIRPQADGVPATIDILDPRPWAPGAPHLYDLDLTVLDVAGQAVDHVRSYAGLRKIHRRAVGRMVGPTCGRCTVTHPTATA